jgi:hypothetical protein
MGGSADTVKMRPLNTAPQKLLPQASAPGSGGSAALRIVKFFAALALIPLCIGLTQGVHAHFLNGWARMNYAVFGPGTMLNWFLGGVGLFTLFAVLLWRPVVVYVFAHEVTHALAAWMCLGKVSNLTASARGGQVTTSKTNTFIRLAPYCVPLYAVIVALAYVAMDRLWKPMGSYAAYLALALGFFYAFHVGFTLWSLRRDQPDLKADGWLFSLVIIYLANVLIFAMLFSFVQDSSGHDVWPALRESCMGGVDRARHMYDQVVQACRNALQP